MDILNDSPDFPLLKEALYEDIVIGPGDMLFIPRGYWHYVQAINTTTANAWYAQHNITTNVDNLALPAVHSFSVSFWWGKRIIS